MKKIILLLSFCLLLVFTACSKTTKTEKQTTTTTTSINSTTQTTENNFVFEIISPKNNEIDVDINTTIEWTENEKASSYTVLLYEQPSNIVVFSETVNTLNVEPGS